MKYAFRHRKDDGRPMEKPVRMGEMKVTTMGPIRPALVTRCTSPLPDGLLKSTVLVNTIPICTNYKLSHLNRQLSVATAMRASCLHFCQFSLSAWVHGLNFRMLGLLFQYNFNVFLFACAPLYL
jgi:hypothetical protein